MKNICKHKTIDIRKLSWGKPPAPLLPRSLRHMWADEPLPDWVCSEFKLENSSTINDLTPNVWCSVSNLSERLRHYLLFLLRTRLRSLTRVPCFDQAWPIGLKISDVGWSVRTLNRIRENEIDRDLERLVTLTFGDLAKLDGMGVQSMLDFTCTLEGAMDYCSELVNNVASDGQGANDLLPRLRQFGEHLWTEEISNGDPRFRMLLPPGEGTLQERVERILDEPDTLTNVVDLPALIQAIDKIEDEVARINRQPLETQLNEFLLLISKANGDRLEALVARFGWGGEKPFTLEASGELLGVTRERIRQIQSKIIEKIPLHPVFMPKLDDGLRLLEEKAPISVEDASRVLKETGISLVKFHPEALLDAARLLNKATTLEICETRNKRFVAISGAGGLIHTAPTMARKLAGQSGVSNVFQVVRVSKSKGIECDEDQVRRALENFSQFEFLDHDWFWCTDITSRRNRLYNISRKILCVVHPQSISSMRDGIRRYFSWRTSPNNRYKTLLVPPLNILEKFYRRHPDFLVNADEVSFRGALDYRVELGETDRVLVEVLRESPTGLLDRKGLAEACIRRGINENTFTVYTTYSPVLDHVFTNIWKLRGVKVAPASVEAIREANHLKPREKRVWDYGWTEDGRLRLLIQVPSLSGSLVVGCPSGFKRFLTGKEFDCISNDDTPCGKITVSEDGTSYGYGVFIRRYGVDEGDVLVVDFDPMKGKAYLEIGTTELFNDL